MRVVAFGTSLTANGGWQVPLADALKACTRRPVEISNAGRAGAASDWGARMAGEVAASRPDFVFLEFAANDSNIIQMIGPSSSTANMRRIVRAFREQNPDVIVYVMTMNPFSGLRSWVRPFRDRYEAAHRDIARELDIRYLDHRPAWSAMAPDELYLEIADGVHPTTAAAAAIVVPGIMTQLQGDGVVRCAEPMGPRG